MGESMAYSARATPALVALCQAAYADLAVFGWLLAGTHHTETHQGGAPLAEAQAARRRVTKQPFFVNYWWGDKVLAACRPEGSRASEVDAMLFFQAECGRRLAMHIEWKAPGERFAAGQAEAYRLRARHFVTPGNCPRNMVPHEDWLTLLVCDRVRFECAEAASFDRVICHEDVAARVAGYRWERQRHV